MILLQSLNLLTDKTEQQTSAVNNCIQWIGAITTAERLINTDRQILCTVEEEEDSDVEGERIKDKLVVLRDIVFYFSSTEQQLNSSPAHPSVNTDPSQGIKLDPRRLCVTQPVIPSKPKVTST